MALYSRDPRRLRLDLNELRLWTVWLTKATDEASQHRSLDQIISACDRISAAVAAEQRTPVQFTARGSKLLR